MIGKLLRVGLVALAALALTLPLAGCGKKGPLEAPPKVTDSGKNS